MAIPGPPGRGFAVVADEVRKLAEKTHAATKEVGGLTRQARTLKTLIGQMKDQSAGQGAPDVLTASAPLALGERPGLTRRGN